MNREQIEKTERMAKLIKARRNNEIYGETDPVLQKLLDKGCIAAFRHPDDGNIASIIAKSNSNLYFVHLVDVNGSSTVETLVTPDTLQRIVAACQPVDATPLIIVRRNNASMKIFPVLGLEAGKTPAMGKKLQNFL